MPKVIVSLTSYPKRIHTVYKVIESLWNQKKCADRIILYLSIEEFPQKASDLPKELVEMIEVNGFHIEWVEGNLKSHKKYYDALQQYENDIVITVDDDIKYADTLISDLIESYERFPNAISARRARVILKKEDSLEAYQEWDTYVERYANLLRMDLCAIGVGGILYPPHSATKEWIDKEKIVRLADNQDDLWLKCNELMSGIPVTYVVPTQNDISVEGTQESALSLKNMCQGENDICIDKLCEYMRNNHSEIFNNWFASLMTKEEFVLEKKGYYFSCMQKKFDAMDDIPIYLYGAGKKAEVILQILEEGQLLQRLEAILVSDKQNNPDKLFGLEVKQLDEIDKENAFYVIYGVGKAYQPEVENMLKDYQCNELQLDIAGIVRYYKK